MKRWIYACTAAIGGILGSAAHAHTTVESSTPANGAVLERSPATIEIKFKHPVQVTSIVVVDSDKTERKLKFEPTVSTGTVRVADPALRAGRSELRWKALSKDGHVIGGTLNYTVKPSAASP